MKIKKTLVSVLILSIIALVFVSSVSAEEDSDTGSGRPMSCIAPLEITIEIPTVTE